MMAGGVPRGVGSSRDGYALLLVLFLLAMATAVGLVVMGNGLSARKLARVASIAAGQDQRAAAAAWVALDALLAQGDADIPPPRRLVLDGQALTVTVAPETGRIDLNGLSRRALVQAIHTLGFSEGQALKAADAITAWRGMDPPGANGLDLTIDPVRALWSLEDLDAIPGLDPDVAACLRRWGTVYARGPFGGLAPLVRRPGAKPAAGPVGGEERGEGPLGLVAGGMVRVTVAEEGRPQVRRSVLLYRGVGRQAAGSGTEAESPWLTLEWQRPVLAGRDACAVTDRMGTDRGGVP
ncbi:type II secretion system (T2SS) protein K [Nitrospirillum bahiense]|uniref:Type II secretion system (T2SS) protein K n=1 Tax=Nitrospirillum amazonense TaxID=28077 RepID=A0A560GE01_9PROT|nr:type II secretion system (T2SS) protein K [Nitrospirillum amazonense]